MFLGATARKYGAIHNPRAWGARFAVPQPAATLHAAMVIAAHASSGGIYVTGFGSFEATKSLFVARKTSDILDDPVSLTISGDFCFGDGANLQATARTGSVTAAEAATIWNSIASQPGEILKPPVPLYVPPGEWLFAIHDAANTLCEMLVMGIEIDAL